MRKTATVAAIALLTGCGGDGAGNNPAQGGTISQAQRNVAETELPPIPQGREIQVLAFGDSLFAGYNIPRGDAYPAQLEAGLRARGINARVINAGVSGDTTAAGLQRLDFVLNGAEQQPALAVVEFGGNDLLRGLPPEQARENLDAIMARFDRENIPVVLMGLQAPPNMGSDYQRKFNAIYPDLAKKYDAALVPLFVAPLLEDRTLVQADQIHPTSDGVAAMVGATIDTIAPAVEKAGEAE